MTLYKRPEPNGRSGVGLGRVGRVGKVGKVGKVGSGRVDRMK